MPMVCVPLLDLQSRLWIQQSVQSPALPALRALELGHLVRLAVTAAAAETPRGQVPPAAEQDPAADRAWPVAATAARAATTPAVVQTAAPAAGEPRAAAAAAAVSLVAALGPETAQAVPLVLVAQEGLGARTRPRVQRRSGQDSLEALALLALLAVVVAVAAAVAVRVRGVAAVVLVVVAAAQAQAPLA